MLGKHRVLQVGVKVDDDVSLTAQNSEAEPGLAQPLDLVVDYGQALTRSTGRSRRLKLDLLEHIKGELFAENLQNWEELY